MKLFTGSQKTNPRESTAPTFDPPPTSRRSKKRSCKPRWGFRYWRWPRIMSSMVLFEYALIIPALALTGIADPDTYRTKLWQDGSDNGFNSDPSAPLYAAANYLPADVPLIWSQFLTKYNLVIVVLCMFILLTKTCMTAVAFFYPIFSVFVHALEVGLLAYSVYGQSSSDLIDPDHQVHGPPWYITKNCNVAFRKSNITYCQQAKSQFIVMILMLALYCIWMLFSLHSLFWAPKKPTDPEKGVFFGRKSSIKEPPTPSFYGQERQWEMVRIPDTPGTTGGLKSPITPRTRAFRELEGDFAPPPGRHDLPLREKSGLSR